MASKASARLVQDQPERGPVLLRLACDVIPAAKPVREALAVGTEDQAPHAAQCLCCREHDLRIGVTRLHKPGRVHLPSLEVNGFAPNRLAQPSPCCQPLLINVHHVVHGLSEVVGCEHVDIGARGGPCSETSSPHVVVVPEDGRGLAGECLPAVCMTQGSSTPAILRMSGTISSGPWLAVEAVPKRQ